MKKWKLNIPDDTDRGVRDLLSRQGAGEPDLSAFVNDAVRREVLRRTVLQIQDQNSQVSEEDARRLADEAIAWARENPA